MSEEDVTNVVIKREDFSKFLNTLRFFQDVCTDCDVTDGIVRQRTNDRHGVIEIDLTNAIGENSVTLSFLKTKIMLLKSFELDQSVSESDGDETIDLKIDDKNLNFVDKYSTLSFRIPSRKFLDNTFMTTEDLDKMFKLKEEDLLISHTISSYMCKRIKTITEGFDSDMVIWRFNKFEASLETETSNKENSSKLIKDIVLNAEMEKSVAKMIALPFMLDVNSDIKIDGYKIGKDKILSKFQMKYFGIPISIYAQSKVEKVK